MVSDPSTRATNTSIAENYDALVYDGVPNRLSGIPRIYGLASAFGKVRTPCDVLDIGCGTGGQLAEAGQSVAGRLVGTDISPVACEMARERLAQYGERATVLCGDLLELEPDELGEFDLIYVVGVIYVTPDAVQRKILDLIGRCLRPGGVVQISYYAGTLPTLRAQIYGLLRSAARDAASRDEALALARQRLAEYADAIADVEGADLLRVAARRAQDLSDLFFFHEVLNGPFVPLQTGELEYQLSQYGIDFVGYSQPHITDAMSSSRDRAGMADQGDILSGQYRYATFAKFAAKPAGPMAEWPVVWECALVRENRETLAGPQRFYVPNATPSATAHDAATIAALDVLADGPASWPDIAKRVNSAVQVSASELELVKENLCQLWRSGLAAPLYAPELANPPLP